MSKKTCFSWLLCLIFLSTFFAGCKPQEKTIAPEKKIVEVAKKVVKKTDFVAEEISPETFVFSRSEAAKLAETTSLT